MSDSKFTNWIWGLALGGIFGASAMHLAVHKKINTKETTPSAIFRDVAQRLDDKVHGATVNIQVIEDKNGLPDTSNISRVYPAAKAKFE